VRRADQIGGLVLLVFAVGYASVALQYPYRSSTGPGSGFLPFWLGVAMGVLAFLLLIGATRSSAPDAAWLPEGRGLRKLGIVMAATVAFAALLKVMGLILAGALFLVGILRFVERYPWPLTLAIAAGTVLVEYVVFVRWLSVPLPEGPFGF
jgi:putative tricarboxylic transport membrane protein